MWRRGLGLAHMKRNGFHQSFSQYLLIGLSAVMVGGAGWRLFAHGSVDALWLPDGVVEWVLPASPAAEQLSVGERVVAVDGVAATTSWLSLNGAPIGSRVTIEVSGIGGVREVVMWVGWPSFAEILQRASAVALGLAFWVAGFAIFRGTPRNTDPSAVILTVAFFSTTASLLSIGAIAGYGPDPVIWLYGFLLWIVGPLGTLLHLEFPRANRLARSRLLRALFLVVIVVGFAWQIFGPSDYPGGISRMALNTAYLWFGLHVLVSIGLLGWSWRSALALSERRQLGVVAVGGVISLVPLALLIVLPRVLQWQLPGDADIAMLPLALLPASYTYAQLRQHRLAQDKQLARTLVYAFTVAVISILVALVFLLPGIWDLPREYLVGVAILVGALAAGPTSRVIEQWLGWLLFGRLRQPLVAAARATDAIDLSIDSDDLMAQVAAILKTQLDIEHCAILVLDREHRLIDPAETGRARAAEGLEIKPGSALDQWLVGDTSVIEIDEARQKLLDTPGRVFFGVPWVNLMLPLRNQGRLVGVLLTSYRSGASFLDEEDIIVLKLTAQALATALQRRTLLVELREKNAEASQLSHELMRVRGEERKRIARDLHDDIVQPLIATSYTVAVMPDPAAEQVRLTLTELIERTRDICFELREPALDNLSFGAAARAVLSAFTQRTGREVKARIADGSAIQVGEAISAAALGVLDEALTNGEKHGGGEALQVDVRVSDDVLVVVIRDTGPGFDVAEARQRAAQTRHFGLAIMEERAASVGGQLSVASSPGRGTTITGYFPLAA